MGITAYFAILSAAAVSDGWSTRTGRIFSLYITPRYLFLIFVRFASLGVYLYNLQLSRGIRLMIVGDVVPWLSGIATSVMIRTWLSGSNATFPMTLSTIHWAVSVTFSLLYVVGLAVTFRDIRRKLANSEDLQEKETSHPTFTTETSTLIVDDFRGSASDR